jgi:PDZ domain-containing protein
MSMKKLALRRQMLPLSSAIVAIALSGCIASGAKEEAPASSPTSMLGIKGLDTPPPFAAAAKLDPPRGVFVLVIDRGSLAERAGIMSGDIILTYDGHPIVNIGAMLGALARTPMGSTSNLPTGARASRTPSTLRSTRAGESGVSHRRAAWTLRRLPPSSARLRYPLPGVNVCRGESIPCLPCARASRTAVLSDAGASTIYPDV